MAERMAVLRVATGRGVTVDSSTAVAAAEVLRLWRRQVVQLRDAGWGPAQGVRFQYLRNCPPSGVEMKPAAGSPRMRLRSCTCQSVCPWCWSREVARRSFDATVAALERLGETFERGETLERRFKLVVSTSADVRIDSKREPGASLDQLVGSLGRAKHELGKFAAGFGLLGVVSPGKTGWVYSQRAIALVPCDRPPGSAATKTYDPPTRRNLAKAVARFARYPAGMLRGDADRAVRLLAARGSYRLLRFSGAFATPGRSAPDPDIRVDPRAHTATPDLPTAAPRGFDGDHELPAPARQ